jgi:hypothetical protein
MVLFHNIVEIFTLPDGDTCLVGPIVALDSGSVAATLINRNLFRQSLGANRLP